MEETKPKAKSQKKRKEEKGEEMGMSDMGGPSCTEVNTQKRGIPSDAPSKQNPEALCVHSKSDIMLPLQTNLLAALEKSMGVVSTACDALGISRTNHYKWMKEDAEYKARYEELRDVALDFAESKLYEMIGQNNTAATIFYLKTKGKDRGYVERQEVQVSQETPDLSGYSTEQLLELVDVSSMIDVSPKPDQG